MRKYIMLGLAAVALAGCSGSNTETEAAAPTYSADHYRQAIADIARPAADREKDVTRKPGELLAFAEIDKGEKVGDYIMGGGYVTRLMAISVGADGKVYAFQPTEFINFRPEYATEQDDAVAPYENVVALRGPITEPAFPEPLDTIITVMNFHDLYIGAMPEGTADKAIMALHMALKPGGTLVVVDHAAAQGTGTSSADKLHRIEKQAVIDALAKHGFALDGESDLYANPGDPHDANVFDDSIRGKTDQFALRFHKTA